MFAAFAPGPMELIIILVICLLLFGAGKLPQVLGQMGKGVKAFKDGVNEKDADLLESKDRHQSDMAANSEKVTDVKEVHHS